MALIALGPVLHNSLKLLTLVIFLKRYSCDIIQMISHYTTQPTWKCCSYTGSKRTYLCSIVSPAKNNTGITFILSFAHSLTNFPTSPDLVYHGPPPPLCGHMGMWLPLPTNLIIPPIDTSTIIFWIQACQATSATHQDRICLPWPMLYQTYCSLPQYHPYQGHYQPSLKNN